MSSFSILERQGSFSGTDDELSGEGLFACAVDGSEEDEAGEVPELKEVARWWETGLLDTEDSDCIEKSFEFIVLR